MSLRDILVYLDLSAPCDTRIEVALALAREHAALLTGVSILTHEYYQPRQPALDRRHAEMGARFRQRAAEAGVTAAWRGTECPVVGIGAEELLIRHSHCTDLIVAGQEGLQGGAGPRRSVVERLVLGAGRPVLIVPAVGTFPNVGTRILVAWRASREAARAVNDALPILRRARQVTLLSVTPAEAASDDPLGGIHRHLQRHGIDAVTERQPRTSSPTADILLNRACEGGFDLLVMGASGTMPPGVAQLGPVAAQILRQMTLPVLMTH